MGWTIGDNPVSAWVSDENLTVKMNSNGSTFGTHLLLRAHDIPGGDSAQYTLSLSSEDPTSTSLWPVLRYAVIQTGAQTPVHLLDNVWVSARHPGMKYRGQWFDREFPRSGMRQTNVVDSSTSFDFVSESVISYSYSNDAYLLPLDDTYSHIFFAAGRMSHEVRLDGIRVPTTLNNSGFEPGWHDLNVTVTELSVRDGLFSPHGLCYHPLTTVKRMVDTYFDTGTRGNDEPTSDANARSGPNVKAIVGGAVGAFAAVVCFLLLSVVLLRRRGRLRRRWVTAPLASATGKGAKPST